MKLKDAKDLINECKDKDGILIEQELESLLIWAFDKGWQEGRDELRNHIFDSLD